MSAWISVLDRMPATESDTSGPMLVWVPRDREPDDTPESISAASVFIADYCIDEGWLVDYEYKCEPSHWMPLPAPPGEQQ